MDTHFRFGLTLLSEPGILVSHFLYGSDMATLSTLITLIARCLRLPETTVGAYAKALRGAGHITSGGRGKGGAEMTTSDVTLLLLAVLTRSVTHAVDNALSYWLFSFRPSEYQEDKAISFLKGIGLTKECTFGEVLETFIRVSVICATDAKIIKIKSTAEEVATRFLDRPYSIIIEIFTNPYRSANILLERPFGDKIILTFFGDDYEGGAPEMDHELGVRTGFYEKVQIGWDVIDVISRKSLVR